MAVGDIISGMSPNVANLASFNFQPAAGVEVIILRAGGSSPLNCILEMTDGTSVGFLGNPQTTNEISKVGFIATNTNYFRVDNQSGAIRDLFYNGIQTK